MAKIIHLSSPEIIVAKNLQILITLKGISMEKLSNNVLVRLMNTNQVFLALESPITGQALLC